MTFDVTTSFEEPRPAFLWHVRALGLSDEPWSSGRLNILARTPPQWHISFLLRLIRRHGRSVCEECALLWVVCLKLSRWGITLNSFTCTAQMWWIRHHLAVCTGPVTFLLIKHRKWKDVSFWRSFQGWKGVQFFLFLSLSLFPPPHSLGFLVWCEYYANHPLAASLAHINEIFHLAHSSACTMLARAPSLPWGAICFPCTCGVELFFSSFHSA